MSDAVFGKSKRPLGFCRNANRPCALKSKGRHTCSKSSETTCTLKRPEFLVLAYQDGPGKNRLLRTLHYSAYLIEIPAAAYGNADATSVFLIDALRQASNTLPTIAATFQRGACPLLLPPNNFGMGRVVERMLDRILAGADLKAEITQFRRERFDRERRTYKARSGLGFSPAIASQRHGMPASQAEMALALSNHFRLGCTYDGAFHWDVSQLDGNHLSGKTPFYCRRDGVSHPKGKNVNVLVDDCLR